MLFSNLSSLIFQTIEIFSIWIFHEVVYYFLMKRILLLLTMYTFMLKLLCWAAAKLGMGLAGQNALWAQSWSQVQDKLGMAWAQPNALWAQALWRVNKHFDRAWILVRAVNLKLFSFKFLGLFQDKNVVENLTLTRTQTIWNLILFSLDEGSLFLWPKSNPWK